VKCRKKKGGGAGSLRRGAETSWAANAGKHVHSGVSSPKKNQSAAWSEDKKEGETKVDFHNGLDEYSIISQKKKKNRRASQAVKPEKKKGKREGGTLSYRVFGRESQKARMQRRISSVNFPLKKIRINGLSRRTMTEEEEEKKAVHATMYRKETQADIPRPCSMPFSRKRGGGSSPFCGG